MDISGSESSGLLSELKKVHAGEGKALENFLIMSFCFAGVRSSSMLALFYASSEFGIDLGADSLAAYYWTFSLTCLVASAPITEYLGSTQAMVLSQVTMSLYLCSYCIGAVVDTTGQWVVVIIGSVIGGFSSGLGWTAQGVYFALYAAQHAKEKGITVNEANDTLAGYWASIYFGGQCVLYLIASLLFQFSAFNYFWCFLALTAGSAIATALTVMFSVAPEGEKTGEGQYDSTMEQAMATIKLSFLNPVALCLQPLNIAYGFALVFLQIVVAAKSVDDHLGTYAVGYTGAIQAGTVALLAVPVAWLATGYGKEFAIGIGSLAACLLSGAFLFWNTKETGQWAAVAPLYILYGVARTTWESTNKAVFADFFTGADRAPAFASLNFVRSVSAASLALAVDSSSVVGLAITMLVPSALMLPGYFYARYLQRQDPSNFISE